MNTTDRLKDYGLLAGLIVAHVLAGFLTGVFFPPGDWVEQLVKPAFYPPAAVFPVVWTFLYALMGVSLWLFWLSEKDGKKRGYSWYVAQMVANLAFSPLMFGLQSTVLGSIDTVILLILLGGTVFEFYRHSRVAAFLLAPYFLWTGFASLVALSLWRLNP